MSSPKPGRWCVLALAIVVAALAAGSAVARGTTKTVRYRGHVIRVPRSWPVYELWRDPTLCVRFDRAAVYLGTPAANERCPAHAVGRHRAILLEPSHRSVEVLHAPRAPESKPGSGGQGLSAHPAQAGGVYTGLGFDACSAPSASVMSAWGASPYRAIAVYIGGTNMACSQANLTSSWVSTETSAGWHLVPTYVGLQAPGNGCGCAAITPSQAQSEGSAAAADAVARAQSVGIGPGNPIYDDMENYTRGGTRTQTVLAFLSAWTAQLHTDGYLSGVYSSGTSGIADLVAQTGTGYLEPDDIWVAHWNGQKTAVDTYLPSGDWANHQRLHQYQGGHNETYGGATLNIDGDYVDASTVSSGGPPIIPAGYWTFTAGGNVYSSAGIRTFGSPAADHARGPAIVGLAAIPDGEGYWLAGASGRIWAYGGAQRLGWTRRSQRVAGIVADPNGGYWLFTGSGSVYRAGGAGWHGSPAANHARGPAIVGMATTADGGGYWMAGASGRIWSFGDAARLGWTRRPHPVAGIVADPNGGYWLFTTTGSVYRAGGAGWFGSPAASHARSPKVVGMVSTPDGGGYWLFGASGSVWRFGDAPQLGRPHPSHPIVGAAKP